MIEITPELVLKPAIMNRVKANKNWLGVICGATGSGKSYWSLSMCETYFPNFDTNNIVFDKSTTKIDYIGSGLKTGKITVNGDAGAFLAFNMSNGNLTVKGNVADFAASGMAGGLLEINGNAGDYLGAAIVGERKGMKGGIVIVKGMRVNALVTKCAGELSSLRATSAAIALAVCWPAQLAC